MKQINGTNRYIYIYVYVCVCGCIHEYSNVWAVGLFKYSSIYLEKQKKSKFILYFINVLHHHTVDQHTVDQHTVDQHAEGKSKALGTSRIISHEAVSIPAKYPSCVPGLVRVYYFHFNVKLSMICKLSCPWITNWQPSISLQMIMTHALYL